MFIRLLLEVVSIRLRRTEAQWFANIRGGLQSSNKCSSSTTCGGLRFLDRPDALPLNLI
jgi:hypothetical protein